MHRKRRKAQASHASNGVTAKYDLRRNQFTSGERSDVTQPAFGMLRADDELPRIALLLSQAFGGTVEASLEWLRMGGPENVRVLRTADRSDAAMLRIPMGQYFGGRSVPMLGIAGVAVAPEARGRGLARQLMQNVLHELYADGWPISCLFASTQSLYRQVGYEQAGYRFQIRLPLAHIDVRERELAVIPLDEGRWGDVERCYRDFASRCDGWLDRGPYIWSRVREFRGEPYRGFGIEAEGRLEGYVFLTQRRRPDGGRQELLLSDIAFSSARAGRRLLGFLSDYAMVGEDVVFSGGPHHSLLWLLGQQRYNVTLKDYWMLRVVNVAAAVQARGYSRSVSAEVPLHIDDDLIEANVGPHVLRVHDGRGRLEPGGSGGIRLGAAAFAALWSGFASPAQLALLGCIRGPEEQLAALAAVFAGPAPSMADMF
jgi:predicted acetyltransferase